MLLMHKVWMSPKFSFLLTEKILYSFPIMLENNVLNKYFDLLDENNLYYKEDA